MPKSMAELGPAACLRTTSAGTTRLSWPPQLTPSLNRRSLSAKAGMSMPGLNSNENRLGRAGEAVRQLIAEAGMMDGAPPHRARQGGARSIARRPRAPSCGSARCACRGSAARHRTATACRRDRARSSERIWPISALRSRDDARHHVAVAAEIFRGRVQDEVDAHGDRPLEHRRRPAIVDDGQNLVASSRAPPARGRRGSPWSSWSGSPCRTALRRAGPRRSHPDRGRRRRWW